MKRNAILLTAILCVASFMAALAQEAAVKKIIDMGRNDNRTMEHLDVLCNRFGGRLVGSAAYEDAAEWVGSKFKEWGLEVEFQEAGSVPVGFNRGPWFGRMLGEQCMELHFVTPSYSSGTKGVQRGHVLIEPRTQEEFDRIKGRLKGAWVLVGGKNAGWAIDHNAKADEERAKAIAENNEIARKNREIEMENWTKGSKKELLPYKEIPGLFYKQMREAGILGVIQSASVPLRALYDRSVVKDSTMTFEKLPTVADIKLDEHQYDLIRQMVKERRDILLEFDIRNHFKMGPVKFYNVIGSLKGSKRPDEYVMVSAHLDAFDVATGGVDDGAGMSPLLESARMIALSGAKPKRTILFCAFAAEEFGLLGSTAWVKANREKLPKIANLFNRDGGPTPPVGINVPKAMYKDFVKICEPIMQLHPEIPFEVKEVGPRTRPTHPGGTDATVFAVEGVPTIGFNTDDVKGYNFSYGEIWHTERDLYTKSIPEYQEHASTVTAVVALGVANLDNQLSREGLYK